MKNAIRIASLLVVLFLVSNENYAQIQNVWLGGMPGRPIDWNVAANWSLHRVPNEFHDVVIPNTATTTFSYPVIDDVVTIHSLRIESGAKLVILEDGKLNLNAVGSSMDDALANEGEIENRSHNLIGFDESIIRESSTLAASKQ